ncbi:hypothetical protein P5X52_03680 [Kocuria palustris]|nr:hypothetical protein [Kocuria palustris]MDH5151178.1 hypothetical protein [Kocuria palustris]
MDRLTPRIGQLRAAHSQSALRPVGVCGQDRGHDALDLRLEDLGLEAQRGDVLQLVESGAARSGMGVGGSQAVRGLRPAPGGPLGQTADDGLAEAVGGAHEVGDDPRHVRAVGRVLDDEGAGVLAHVDAEPQLARGPVAQEAHPGEPADDVPHRASDQEAAVPLVAGSRRSTEGTPPDRPARRAAEALAVGFGPRPAPGALDAVSTALRWERAERRAEGAPDVAS